MQTTSHISAILRGEQRSKRFRYRHSALGAANELGIPVTWIWYWLFLRKLKFKIWLRKVWVKLEAVQKLFADPDALREAFHATGEFLVSAKAIQQVAECWPGETQPYIKFQAPAKRPPQSVTPDPVDSEERKSEVVA